MPLRDPVSSASHLLTAVWAAFATVILLRLIPNNPRRRLAVGVFGLSMVLLYLASGTFHGLWYDTRAEMRFFQKLDQSAIFVLIAGTNTPCMAVLIGGRRGRWLLATMWGLAACGIGCLWLLPEAPHWVVVMNYLLMGWLGIVPVFWYIQAVGWRAMNWVWLGAGMYTFGAVCELTKWPVLMTWPTIVAWHEVLHFTDTAGSMAFFVFVSRYVVPFEGPAVGDEPIPAGDQNFGPRPAAAPVQ